MKIDYRTKKGRAIRELKRKEDRRRLFRLLISIAILTSFAVAVLTKTIYDATHSKPLSETKVVEVVQAEEIPQRAFCNDVINCIRDVGEELGVDNKVITTAIRIAEAESGYRADAKNPNSSATGVFQFLWSTWDAYKCDGERWDYVDNTRCFYKLYIEQTARYARKGLVYDFSDWNASRSKWDL